MKVEIINIGDELLNGTTVNTNATWLCQQSVKRGGSVVSVSMVRDDTAQILEGLRVAESRADIVFITGGLGPTVDDKTKESVLVYFGGDLIPDKTQIARIRKLFAERGLEITARNIAQGWVPNKAVIYSNPIGTAPAMEFIKSSTKFIFLPGVPREMKRICEENIHLWLEEEQSKTFFIMDEIMIIGVSESFVADKLSTWQKQLPGWLSLSYLPSSGYVKVRLSCYHNKKDIIKKKMRVYLKEALDIYPENAFYTGGFSWDEYFNDTVKSKGVSIAIAESCTGGYLSHRITSVPGSSLFFKGGIVAYHNNIKRDQLDVSEEILNNTGAVSRETVTIMAKKIKEKYKADVGVAVSGIAGPDGGSKEKPVGTIWIAVSFEDETVAEKFLMGSDRILNIKKSSLIAMMMVLKKISKFVH